MTDAEQLMWYLLRSRRFANLKFRRQHPVPPFVLDFYCDEKKLGVELDGGQHNEDTKAAKDQWRTRLLESKGIRVVRYWNHDVLGKTEEVLTDLWNVVHGEDSPSPGAARRPLPAGEGKMFSPLPSGRGGPAGKSDSMSLFPAGPGGEGESAGSTLPEAPGKKFHHV